MEKMTDTSLTDAIYDLSMGEENISAEFLDEIIRRYPQHADSLKKFAVELVIDSVLYDVDETHVAYANDQVNPVVTRLMSKLQNGLYDVRQKIKNENLCKDLNSLENPFLSLDRPGFRSLVIKIGINTIFLSKIRDLQIDPKTIPERFIRHLADKMQISSEILRRYLFGNPSRECSAQFFSSPDRPTLKKQQSFEDAVRQSNLDDNLQKNLMSFMD